MDLQDIVVELEDLIRTAPDPFYSWGLDQLDWMGRAKAVLSRREVGLVLEAGLAVQSAMSNSTLERGKERLIMLLHQARHSLRMETVGPMSAAVGKGMVFDYFDALRKVIEEARSDLFFVDPYLDADFVSRYLPFAGPSVKVRLLGREKIMSLRAAASQFAEQNGADIEVRSGSGFHDRFLFIDGRRAFQSGASFKDGGLKTPTVLLELGDVMNQVADTYNGIWSASS